MENRNSWSKTHKTESSAMY